MDKLKDKRVLRMIADVMQSAYIDLPNEVKSEYNLEGSQNFRRSLPIDFLNVEIQKYISKHNLDLEFHKFKNASLMDVLFVTKTTLSRSHLLVNLILTYVEKREIFSSILLGYSMN